MANHTNSECAICLDQFEVTNRALLVCGHAIHVHCLVELAKHSNRCPMCREAFYQTAQNITHSSDEEILDLLADTDPEPSDEEVIDLFANTDSESDADEIEEEDEENWGFSRSDLSLLADSTADRQRHNWPRIPNTWPGHRTAMGNGYEFFRTCYKRRLPNFNEEDGIECRWALNIAKVMVVWYVFYKVAKQTVPQLKTQFYEGVSKQQIVDFMILGGMDFHAQLLEAGFKTLQDQGHVYSTTDDFHFNLTDATY